MEIKKNIRVALIKPPILGHLLRGTGIYTDNLFTALQSIKNLKIELVEIKSDLSKFDIIHFPYFDPFFLTLPAIRNYKTVVTVHDLIPLEYPQNFPMGFKGRIKWEIQKRSLKNTNAIITDSVYSKKQIAEFVSYTENHIYVIPLGLRREFREKIILIDRDILKKYNLPERYILNVGDINYNKNIPGLLEAFSQISKYDKNLGLVLVGKGFTADSIGLKNIIDLTIKLEIKEKVTRLSDLSTTQLIALYRNAKIYIQPSFAEGFGLTVLEALSSNCPVISSYKGSLPEIGQDAVYYINPGNIKKMAEAIKKVLTDKDLQNKLKKRGQEIASVFTWQKCAEQTALIYQRYS